MWEAQGALAAAGPWGLPGVEALPKSIRAQSNASGSQLAGFSPHPGQNQTFLCSQGQRGARGASAVPRQRRCQPAKRSSPSCACILFLTAGQEGEQLCQAGSSRIFCSSRISCSELSPSCPGRGAHSSFTLSRPCLRPRGEKRTIANPNHQDANPPRSAFKVRRAATGAKSIGVCFLGFIWIKPAAVVEMK